MTGAKPSSQPPPVLIIVARQLRMEDVEEHRFYLSGAAEPHFQVHERRVARFKVAQRIGGGGDLVGLRSKPPGPGTASRTVASPATSSSTHVEAELIRLACADAKSLARRWRVLFGIRGRRTCPVRCCSGSWPTGSRPMRPAISILTTIKLLDRLGRGRYSEIPLPELRAVKPGTLLVREWDGTLQRVVVLESGFAWNGVTYESLSKVARAITGTNWNGPRFFGLRDRARAS